MLAEYHVLIEPHREIKAGLYAYGGPDGINEEDQNFCFSLHQERGEFLCKEILWITTKNALFLILL